MPEEPTIYFLKALSNELSAFMILIVHNRFARHIMNTQKRPPSTLILWIAMWDAGAFFAIRIQREKCKCQPIGNQK